MKTLRILILLSMVLVWLGGCAPAPQAPQIIEKTVEVPVEKTVVVEKTVEVPVEVVKTVEVPTSKIPKDAKLTFWMFASYVEGMDDYFLGQVKEWSDLTGVPVDVTFISNEDMPAKFNAALEAKDTLPDLVAMDGTFFPKFYDAQVLADVSDVVKEIGAREGGFIPGAIAAFTVDGKSYAIPFMADIMASYFRKDLFEKNGGIPATYEDFSNACKKINKADFYCWGLNMGGGGDNEYQMRGLIWSFGGQVTSPDGKTATLNSPETIAAMNYLKAVGDAGSFPPDFATVDDFGNNQYWISKQAAYISNTGSVLAWMQGNDPEYLKSTEMTIPLKGPVMQAATMNVVPFAMTTNSKYPDLAKSLLGFVTAPEREWQYMETSGYASLPVYQNLINRKVYTSDSFRNSMAQTLLYSYVDSWPAPLTSATAEIYTTKVLSNMALSILVDKVPVEEAVAKAQAQVEEILDRYYQ